MYSLSTQATAADALRASAALRLPRERHIRGDVQHHEQDCQAADAAAHAELHVLAGQDVIAALPPCGEVRRRRSMLHQQ